MGAVSQVILGTVAHREPELVRRACEVYGERMLLIDAKNGRVAISGWQEGTDVLAYDLGLRMKRLGVRTIISPTLLQDGMLSGPNYEILVKC